MAFSHKLTTLVVVFSIFLTACGGEEMQPESGTKQALANTGEQPVVSSDGGEAPQCETFPAELFAYAEKMYPEFFNGGYFSYSNLEHAGKTFTVNQYIDNYLGVDSEGFVYVLGKDTGYNLVGVGHSDDYACAVKQAGYGNKRILVTHLKFADSEADPFPISDTVVRTNKIAQFFKEISYGKSIQTYDVKPWVKLPHRRSEYERADPYAQELANWKAPEFVATQHDLNQYDIVVMIIEPVGIGYPGCLSSRYYWREAGRWKIIPTAVLSGVDFSCVHADVMSHEIAHAYGLPTGPIPLHSSMFACKTWSRGLPQSFTDPVYNELPCEDWSANAVFYLYAHYDVLGGYRGHLSSFWKSRFGWIRPTEVTTVTTGKQLTLAPLEVVSSAVKAAKVPLGDDQAGVPAAYWVEYRSRAPASIESDEWVIQEWRKDRVKVWVNLDSIPKEPLDSAGTSMWQAKLFTFWHAAYGPTITELAIGETFHDPYRGVKVTRGQNVGTAAQVTIDVTTLALSDPIGVTLSTGSTRTVTVTNKGTSNVTQSSLALKGRTPTAFRLTADGCGNKTLTPGGSCSFTVSYAPTAGDTELKFAHVEWTTNDRVRTIPTVGLVGTP